VLIPGAASHEIRTPDMGQLYDTFCPPELGFAAAYGFSEKPAECETDRTRFIVYGTATAELREILDGFGATYFLHFGGFSR